MRQITGGEKIMLVFLGGEVRFETHPKWTLHFGRFSGMFLILSLIMALVATVSGYPPTAGLQKLVANSQGGNSFPLVDGIGSILFDAPQILFLFSGLGIGLINLNRLAKRQFRMLRVEDIRISGPLPWR
jgi:hypothetical protein